MTGSPAAAHGFDTHAGFLDALDTLLVRAERTIAIFDRDLSAFELERPARIERLDTLLRAGPQSLLRVVVHHSESLEKRMPRMQQLCLRLGHRLEIRRSPASLHSLQESVLIVDGRHVLRRFHADYWRGTCTLDDTFQAHAMLQRFEALWEQSDRCTAATNLGL